MYKIIGEHNKHEFMVTVFTFVYYRAQSVNDSEKAFHSLSPFVTLFVIFERSVFDCFPCHSVGSFVTKNSRVSTDMLKLDLNCGTISNVTKVMYIRYIIYPLKLITALLTSTWLSFSKIICLIS